MMIGAFSHCRSFCSTSWPSISGRPRSRITRSGGVRSADSKACWPLAASNKRYPASIRDEKRKSRIALSSSISRMRGLSELAGIDYDAVQFTTLLLRYRGRRRTDGDLWGLLFAGNRNCEFRAARRAIGGRDSAAVGLDDSLANGQAQAYPATAICRGGCRGTEKLFENL